MDITDTVLLMNWKTEAVTSCIALQTRAFSVFYDIYILGFSLN